jgi:hypothetical protein
MASANERFPAGGKWYDPNNPGELHDDLRLDYASTYRHATIRPSVRRHMQACGVCQEIAAATTAAPSPTSTRKRIKLVIDKSQMHQLLRLPASFEIVHMFADNDPNYVGVLVAGEGLPEVAETGETPLGRIGDVHGDTTPTAS